MSSPSPLQKGIGFAIAGTAAGFALFKLLSSRNARKQAEAEQLQVHETSCAFS